MNTLSRRNFVCACGLGLSGLLVGCLNSAVDEEPDGNQTRAQTVRGCGLAAGSSTAALGCGTAQASGNPALDQVMSSEFAVQRAFWGFPVGLLYLDDCMQKNAFADPQTRTIYFGVRLISDLLTRLAELPVAFVLAHEYAHHLQFLNGWYDFGAPTVREPELTADVLGGFYLLLAKSFADPFQFQATLAAAFETGDYAFNDPTHHGTPLQRAAAVVAGGRIALDFRTGRLAANWPAIHARARQEIAAILADPRLAQDRLSSGHALA